MTGLVNEAIRVTGLEKQFGDLRVLQGIHCAVNTSEVVCVIGPSGSGKSTFLRCLNGLEEASAGSVWVHGVSVHDPRTDLNTLRADIGMVFQRFNLFPHKTVLQNITVAPTVAKGVRADEAESIARELLGKVGLLNVIENDKHKARIATIMPVPRGMKVKAAFNPLVYFSLDEFDAKLVGQKGVLVEGRIILPRSQQHGDRIARRAWRRDGTQRRK